METWSGRGLKAVKVAVSTRRCILRPQVWRLGGPSAEVLRLGGSLLRLWLQINRLLNIPLDSAEFIPNEGTKNSGKWPGNESLFQLWKGEECKKFIFLGLSPWKKKKKNKGKKGEKVGGATRWQRSAAGRSVYNHSFKSTVYPSSKTPNSVLRWESSHFSPLHLAHSSWPKTKRNTKLNTEVSTCLKNSNESIKSENSRLFDDLITVRPTRPAGLLFMSLLQRPSIEQVQNGRKAIRFLPGVLLRSMISVSCSPSRHDFASKQEPVWSLWYQ